MSINWFKYASPVSFYPLAGKMIPWFAIPALILGGYGLVMGLFVLPADFKQGESYRIIFIHVPAAWMSMVIYLAMAFWSVIGLIWNSRLSFMMATALAPTGAIFCFVALWTGALWGKPTWGTYWVWDARLTSQLILMFMYLGYIALQAAIEDPRRSARASSLLAIIGAFNVPIIYFSVKWWNTLHQGASVTPTKSEMADSMLSVMLIMAIAAWLYSIAIVLKRVRCEILERERHAAWVNELSASDVDGRPETA